MNASKEIFTATIVSVRGATDLTVRLANGAEVTAVLDAATLRERYGRVYGLDMGGSVEVVLDTPARIVGIVNAQDM